MKIGFMGAGQMAQALAAGMVKKQAAIEFWINDPSPVARRAFRDRVGNEVIVNETDTNAEVVQQSSLVFLAVKPQFVAAVLDGLEGVFRAHPHAILVSVVAGMTIADLFNHLGCHRIIRVMPNTPCLIGKGASGIVASPEVEEQQLSEIIRLLECVGTVVTVTERQLDAVTGLSGSGPAYVFTFIEALIDAGVLNGLPRDVAKSLAVETVLGAAELVRQTGEHTALLRDRVTSPGGTTICGLQALESRGFRDAVMSAVTAATARSRELGSE